MQEAAWQPLPSVRPEAHLQLRNGSSTGGLKVGMVVELMLLLHQITSVVARHQLLFRNRTVAVQLKGLLQCSFIRCSVWLILNCLITPLSEDRILAIRSEAHSAAKANVN